MKINTFGRLIATLILLLSVADQSVLAVTYDISTSDVTLNGETCTITGTTTAYKIIVASGTNSITLDNVGIDFSSTTGQYSYGTMALDIQGGDTTLILTGTNILKSSASSSSGSPVYSDGAGIRVASTATLTVDGTGSLEAQGYGRCAGIGGVSSEQNGVITINGGTITARGGAAGIGAGGYRGHQNISINGGSVTAYGGGQSAAIGSGFYNSSAGNITITAGEVYAYGSFGSAAIGGGDDGTGGTIVISGGTVYAESYSGASYCAIGYGEGADATAISNTTVEIGAGSVKAYAYSSDPIMAGTITATGCKIIQGIFSAAPGESFYLNFSDGTNSVTMPSSFQSFMVNQITSNSTFSMVNGNYIVQDSGGNEDLDCSLSVNNLTDLQTVVNDFSYNVTVSGSSSNGVWSGGSPDVWKPFASGATVSVSEINDRLDNGTSVVINTGSGTSGESGDITISSPISKTGGGAATLTVKAVRSIILSSSVAISSTNNKLNTILLADSDGDSDGGIRLLNSSGITTNGGGVWLGGGSGTANWTPWSGASTITVGDGFAVGNGVDSNGIFLGGTSIDTSGGHITLFGQGRDGAAIDEDSGTLNGIHFSSKNQVTLNSGTGTIYLHGKADSTVTSCQIGIMLNSGGGAGNHILTSSATSGNAITLFGEGGSGGTYNNNGIQFQTGTLTADGGGNILLHGTEGTPGMYWGDIQLGHGSVNAGSGDLIFEADTLALGGATLSLSGYGQLMIQPNTPGQGIAIGASGTGTGPLCLSTGYFTDNFTDGFSGITVGSITQTGDIAISAVTLKDPLRLYTQGSVTQSGAVTGGQSVSLLGTGGEYSLTNTGNLVSNLTADTGSIAFVNSDALTLGSVSATGKVEVATQSGDLTLTGAVSTTDTTTGAIMMNAGKSESAGTSTGGDLIVSGGSLSFGSNGIAKLYTGSIAGSTGVTGLSGYDSSQVYYTSDEASTLSPSPQADKLYVIYREEEAVSKLQEFTSSDSLSTDFTEGTDSSGDAFVWDSTAGLGGGGGILVSTSSSDQIWTAKESYNVTVGGVYTLSAYFKMEANAGYGALGFSTDSVNSALGSNGMPGSGNFLGISFHGGGGNWLNDSLGSGLSWTSGDMTYSPATWYYFELIVEATSGNNFDMTFRIKTSDESGNIGALHTEHTATLTNSGIAGASALYVFFSADGSRTGGIDNFEIQLSGGVDIFYSVTYDDNGADSGSPPSDGTGYAPGDSATVLGNTGTLVKSGYVFDGWNTAADGSGTTYQSGDSFLMGSANLTLFALWSQLAAYNVTIGASSTNGTWSGGDPDVWSPDGSGSSTVSVTEIENRLNAGTSVKIVTGNGGGGENGDITINSSITKSGGTAATLTFEARQSITLNSAISGASGAPLNMVLAARAFAADESTWGQVTINAAMKSYGGDITIGGGNGSASGSAIATGTSGNVGGVIITNMIDGTDDGSGAPDSTIPSAGSGGDITIRGKGNSNATESNWGIQLDNQETIVTAGSGNIVMNGTGGNGTTYFWNVASAGIAIEQNSYIKANNGSIQITGYAGTGYDQHGVTSTDASPRNAILTNGNVTIDGNTLLIRDGILSVFGGSGVDIKAPIVGCSGGDGCSAATLSTAGSYLKLWGAASSWSATNTYPTNTDNILEKSVDSIDLDSGLAEADATYAFSTGSIVLAEPTIPSSNVIFSVIDTSSVTINWTSGDGNKRIVLIKEGGAVDSSPVDLTSYTADAAYGSGEEIGTGNYVVYSGTGSSATVTGLSPGTTYHFAVYEYNGSGGSENYLTTSFATAQGTAGTDYALSFDGADDYVDFSGSNPSYSSTITIEAWIKTTSNKSENNIVSWSNGGGTPTDNVQFRTEGGKLQFGIDDGSSWNSVESVSYVNTGNWIHVAVVKSGFTIYLYIDGVLDNSGSINIAPSTSLMYIGRFFNQSATVYFDGTIDEVRIWNVARTATQISVNKDSTLSGSESGLVAYYPMNEGSGTTLSDGSSSAATGTINGATWVDKSEWTVIGTAKFWSGGGSVSPTSQTVASGGIATFTITPASGSSISNVTGCGGTLSGDTYTTAAVTADCEVTAVFTQNLYTVSAAVSGGNGTVMPPTRTAIYGDTPTFTVQPDWGYLVDSVTGCGGSGSLSGELYTTGAITGDCSLAVTFTPKSYTVTGVAAAHGTIAPSGDQSVDHGDTLTFTITPDTGYVINKVLGGNGTLSGNTFTTGPITGPCKVMAFFKSE